MQAFFKKIFKLDMIGVIIALVIISVILSITAKGFTSPINIDSILKVSSITIIVGLAQLSVLSVGQFNLALGSIGCCSAMAGMYLIQEMGIPIIPAQLIGMLTGFILGWFQGMLVAKSGINPFVVTLALSSIYLGTATVIFRNLVLNQVPVEIKQVNKISLLGIPLLLVIALFLVFIMFIIMNKLYVGRQMLATGESKSAANIAGIKTAKQIVIAHSISAILAAIAGLLTVTRLGSAQLSLGSDWMLMSFAAPVLGGTLLSGGKVSVIGTIFGAVLLNVINAGLVLLDVSFYWTQTFLGVILVLAFGLDRVRQTLLARGR